MEKDFQYMNDNVSDQKEEVEVSIIIPSYNKYPQNLLTLYSLELQTFDFNKFEVIFIDDYSSDQTGKFKTSYHPPFRFQYVLCKENVGRSKARNIGINYAKGDLLIFLDAEMIVEPDFVKNHYQSHQKKNNHVVTGVMYYTCVYSFLYPQFNQREINHIQKLATGNKEMEARVSVAKRKRHEISQLIFKEDLNTQFFKQLSFTKNSSLRQIINNYGAELRGFRLPWLAFLTGNVSVKKSLIDRIGGFETQFTGYGWEDREIGYRLFKEGAKFTFDNNVIAYHQEHPICNSNYHESMRNLYLFQEKHPEFSVLVLTLEYLKPTVTYDQLNRVVEDYENLCKNNPKEFSVLQEGFLFMLMNAQYLLSQNLPIKNLYSGFPKKRTLLFERQQLKMSKKFNHLLTVLNRLISY